MDVGLPIKNPALLIRQLKEAEGFRAFAYKDIKGIITVGYGRNLESNGLSKTEAEYLLQNDIAECIQDLQTIFSGFHEMPTLAQHVLVEMRFNLGPRGFRSFRHFIAALQREDWRSAELELLDSKAARLLPERYQRMGKALRSLAID